MSLVAGTQVHTNPVVSLSKPMNLQMYPVVQLLCVSKNLKKVEIHTTRTEVRPRIFVPVGSLQTIAKHGLNTL